MRNWRFATALILSFVGIAFCFAWRPQDALLVFFPRPQLVFLGLLAVLTAFGPRLAPLASRLWGLSARSWILICGGLSCGAATYLAFGPLDGVPHVPDDICYLWQARTFAQGHLTVPSHDLPEFFNMLFMVNDGKWYSLFQPGWPALMSLAVWPGLEFLVNPLLAGLAVMLVYPIGRRVFDDRTAKLAMLLMALSPLHAAIGATLLAHSLSLVLGEVALLCALRFGEQSRWRDAVGLGIALGWMFTARALNALAFGLVLATLLVIYLVQRRIRLLPLIAASLPVMLVFVGLQLGYNHAITGDALYWPQDHYFDTTEPKKNCHSLGFGKKVGCPKVHVDNCFPDGFTPSDAVGVTHRRLGTFLLTLFGINALLFFIIPPFLTRRYGPRKYLMLAMFLALLVAYFFWYFHGLWGRYYYESAFALFILVAAGLVQTHHWLDGRALRTRGFYARLLLAVVPAVALSYMLFNVVIFYPSTIGILNDFFFSVDRRLERLFNETEENSVIYLEKWYPAGFIYMRPGLAEGRIFVHDADAHNRLMMQYYPDRSFYHFSPGSNRLTPLPVDSAPSPIFMEAEYKTSPGISSGEYCFIENCDDLPPDASCSGDHALAFLSTGEGSFMEYHQFVFADGRYRLRLRFKGGPTHGIVSVRVNGESVGQALDTYAAAPRFFLFEADAPISFSRGLQVFRIELVGKNTESQNYHMGLDWMTLERVEE